MKGQDRKERIRELRRREERRLRLPPLLSSLTEISGRDFSKETVLSVEETDQFQINLNIKNFGFDYLNINVPKSEKERIYELLRGISYELTAPNYFTVHSFKEYGIFYTDTAFIVKEFEKVIEMDGDMFIIYDNGLDNGIWLDLYEEYYMHGEKAAQIPLYELRIFGRNWINKVNIEYSKMN